MLQSKEVSDKDVERSIDRLKTFASQEELGVAIPAFYYSVFVR